MKGPQAPVYFAATVGAFLVYHRQGRALFSWAHAVGIGTFVLVVSAWQVPFVMQLGWPAVRDVWAGDVGLRFVDASWSKILGHFVAFPCELWICLLPGSWLLLAFLQRPFWNAAKPAWPWLSFPLIALAVTLPTCWLVPDGKPRYFLPLFPCAAILMGFVVEQLLAESARSHVATALPWLWRSYLRSFALVAIASSLGVPMLAFLPIAGGSVLQQPPLFAVAFCVLSIALAALLIRLNQQFDANAVRLAVLATAGFCGLMYTGFILNVTLARSENMATGVRLLKSQLPADVQLVSLNKMETVFTYHFESARAIASLAENE